MKNFGILTLVAAACMISPAFAEKLDITVGPSHGNVFSSATPGTKTTAAVLLSVSKKDGSPVQNLQPSDMFVTTFVSPPGNGCGFTATGVSEIKPGFYQITLSLSSQQVCVWNAGDYLATVRVSLVGYFGMAPFQLSIK